jgi:hypothetical protein
MVETIRSPSQFHAYRDSQNSTPNLGLRTLTDINKDIEFLMPYR